MKIVCKLVYPWPNSNFEKIVFQKTGLRIFPCLKEAELTLWLPILLGLFASVGSLTVVLFFYESERKVKIILTCQILLLHNHLQAYKKKLRNTGFICYLNRVILKDVISFAKRNPKIVQNHSVLVTGKLHYKTVIRKVITLSFLLF